MSRRENNQIPENKKVSKASDSRPGLPPRRLAGADLRKHTSNAYQAPQRRPTKMVDSLDLENFPAPKEFHVTSDLDFDEKKPADVFSSHQSSNLLSINKDRKPFAANRNESNSPASDWLERSITQIDLFGRRHRGMLENTDINESVEDYFKNVKKDEQQQEEENNAHVDDDTFMIPELPQGQQLVFNLKSSWGDRHYIGLNGIEIFSSEGYPVVIRKITADPPDINILPEYGNDPRVVGNLIDGVNKTRDDIHMWLAPFIAGRDHFIYITFEQPSRIAMIRIWNYNKSRIYSARGAKDIEITLDGRSIFSGEISQACGGIQSTNDFSSYGETILYTTDDHILEKIAEYDPIYVDQEVPLDDNENNNRPPTAGNDVRPMTRATLRRPFTALRSTGANDTAEFYGNKLILTITENWGDDGYVGLTGLEIVDTSDNECVIQSFDVISPNNSKDNQTLDKLFDRENVTTSENHMWLTPFLKHEKIRVVISLSNKKRLHGLRLWNYNKSSDDTFCGIKRLHVQLNDKIISPRQGFLIRRAPGHCYFDFCQEIIFAHAKTEYSQSKNSNTKQNDTKYFIYEFHILSNHGDLYYVGLNGLEFYDENGEQIGLTENNIAAYPHSVNALNPSVADIRTPEKLIDGENNDIDGAHAWLSPILNGVFNRIFVIFDRPTSVSMIKIWNYSKTPNRGVREFSLLVDDLLVWTGILDRIDTMDKTNEILYNTILFCDEEILTEQEKYTLLENKGSSENASGNETNSRNKPNSIDYCKLIV
ncbi:unnamed protein product [Didymodactylos carnosus]|uniref:KATNIP domain-containing protein n=1 Tax=Didymodactylos carnosus TaxID=1234261 RepID=A0A8S2D1Z6_9BILA|nr:unnamed protein product [Didymodactylos carnosus]CAF3642903.1 unnamed protein product [Didymodactylos carnosus]